MCNLTTWVYYLTTLSRSLSDHAADNRGMEEWTAVSLFSGIGGFEMGLALAGIRTVASVEIEPKARGVLKHCFSDVTLFEDVQEVSGSDLVGAGFNPERGVLTAGFPCQDVSLAGKRAGLAGARTGLFFEIIRILKEVQPRWFLLENVPGLLTSNGGRDMGTVVGTLDELGYGVGWRVLDAQYFGIPQRRRRVIIAGCLGDLARAGEVLLEPESSPRDYQARRAPRTKVAGAAADGAVGSGGGGIHPGGRAVVQALTSARATGGPDAQHAQAGWLIPEKVNTLQAQGSDSRGWRVDAEGAAGGHLIPVPEVAQTLSARYQKGVNTTFDDGALAVSFRKSKRGRHDQDDETWVQEEQTNTLNCFDVGETRATQLVAETFCFYPHKGGPGDNLKGLPTDLSPTLTATDLREVTDRGVRVVAPTGEKSHTLTAEGFDASEDGTGRGWPTVAFALRGREEGIRPEINGDGQQVSTLRSASGGSSKDYLAGEWGVRRLTPRECERLQGFPDDHTLERFDFKKGKVVTQSDSARGHQLGNAVAVPVVEWVARRIVASEAAA